MSVFKQLQPASFRGVPFLVRSESEEAGKKSVTHEFVGSNKRFTEDTLGLLLPKFTIQAIVKDPDALLKRFALKGALDRTGLGELVHPVYGSLQVKSTTYNISSDDKNLGEFVFTIPFEASEEELFPQFVPISESAVTTFAETSRNQLNTAFENSYNVPRFPNELTDVADSATSTYDLVVGDVSKAVGGIQDKIAKLNRFRNDVKSRVLTIVQSAFTLKESLEDLYTGALDIANFPDDLIDSWKRLTKTGFLTDDEVISRDIQTIGFLNATGFPQTNTVPRKEAEEDISILDEHTRLTALINLFEASVTKDYDTEDEINDRRSTLDNTYNRLVNQYEQDLDVNNVVALASDVDFRNSIADLRNASNKILDIKTQNAFKVVAIEPGISSMALVAYRYYGSLDNLDELKDLNPNTNHASFENVPIQAVST